jgi:peptide/nickel transport system permease protein
MPSSTPASASEEARPEGRVRPRPRYEELRRGYRLWRRSPLSIAGTLLVGLIFAVALLAPLVATHDPLAQDFTIRLQPPSMAHLYGTDQFGRDIFSRVVFGSRIALEIILIVSVISGGVGALVGWIAGYFGGRMDEVLMRLTDMFLAFPSLVLAMAFAAALGPSLPNMIMAISLVTWTPYARLARGETLRTKAQDFVEAARAMGASDTRIIFRHVLPMTLSVLIVQLTLRMGTIILTAAGLGFLGLGAQPPTPEWGAMVSDGRNFLVDQWWVSTLPGTAIAAAVLGFNLLGDGVRDILDPRLRR